MWSNMVDANMILLDHNHWIRRKVVNILLHCNGDITCMFWFSFNVWGNVGDANRVS